MVARRLLLTAALACLSAASAQYDAEPPELDGEGRLKPGCAPAIDPGAFAGVARVLAAAQVRLCSCSCTHLCNCAHNRATVPCQTVSKCVTRAASCSGTPEARCGRERCRVWG